ncbi:MAG: hydroxyacid dehydrogenase [Sedimentisphaeraceae bacterium JB056]
MKKAVFFMTDGLFDIVFHKDDIKYLQQYVELALPSYNSKNFLENLDKFKDVNFLFSSWGVPKLDKDLLEAMPSLEAVFYAAGSVRHFVTDCFWEKDIALTTASMANAIPVAEFTFAQIICCLKRQFYFMNRVKRQRDFSVDRDDIAGSYKSKVGIISLGNISKRVIDLLKHTSVDIMLYCITADDCIAKELGVELASIEEIFMQADVVSLHTAANEQTRGMIRGHHFESMKPGASFVNTARGMIVEQEQMIEVLKRRSDLTAVLDVTTPEPPLKDSVLYDMENVILTPHIAGSAGHECRRMGRYMIDELVRYIDNEPLKWRVKKEDLSYLA